jgi:predicted membrane channel-forming protein YqfA (hemolysin III family)
VADFARRACQALVHLAVGDDAATDAGAQGDEDHVPAASARAQTKLSQGAALGIVLRSVWRRVPKYITNTLYITLGWSAVLLAGVASSVPWPAIALMAAGGVAYTVGFAIYVVEKPNPRPGFFGFHELWHVFVVVAALLHYLLIYFYVLPA